MPAILDLIYRECYRARLVEMRRQLLISPERHEVPEAICDARDQSDGLETERKFSTAPRSPSANAIGHGSSSVVQIRIQH